MTDRKSMTVTDPDPAADKVIESLVLRGDLSGLNPRDRSRHYVQMCEGLGLNPTSQPFAYLRLNGKEILYATRGATDQLAKIHHVNREIIDGPKVIDLAGTKLVLAVCRASMPDGRFETATATVPLTDPANVLMKCETKAKRRATLSILGLGLLDEMELETIPASVQEMGGGVDLSLASEPRALEAVSESSAEAWAKDLASCSRLAEVRACYQSAAKPDADNRALCDDVRAWLRARGLCADQAETAAILSTMESALLTALDDAMLEPTDAEPKPDADALVTAARAVKAHGDSHGARLAWKVVARSYSVAEGITPRDAANVLKDLCDTPPSTPVPPITEGSPDAWRETVAGIDAHVAALPAKHVENSARKHLPAIAEALKTHAIHAYARRVRELSQREEKSPDGETTVTSLPWDECVKRVETWLREGPRAAAKGAAGGAR